MPWKESSVMDKHFRFIARLLEGDAMTDLCVEYGISRKTGYKIYRRYKESGGTFGSRMPFQPRMRWVFCHLAVVALQDPQQPHVQWSSPVRILEICSGQEYHVDLSCYMDGFHIQDTSDEIRLKQLDAYSFVLNPLRLSSQIRLDVKDYGELKPP